MLIRNYQIHDYAFITDYKKFIYPPFYTCLPARSTLTCKMYHFPINNLWISDDFGKKTSCTIRVNPQSYFITRNIYILLSLFIMAYIYDHVGEQDRWSICIEYTIRHRKGILILNEMLIDVLIYLICSILMNVILI